MHELDEASVTRLLHAAMPQAQRLVCDEMSISFFGRCAVHPGIVDKRDVMGGRGGEDTWWESQLSLTFDNN